MTWKQNEYYYDMPNAHWPKPDKYQTISYPIFKVIKEKDDSSPHGWIAKEELFGKVVMETQKTGYGWHNIFFISECNSYSFNGRAIRKKKGETSYNRIELNECNGYENFKKDFAILKSRSQWKVVERAIRYAVEADQMGWKKSESRKSIHAKNKSWWNRIKSWFVRNNRDD